MKQMDRSELLVEPVTKNKLRVDWGKGQIEGLNEDLFGGQLRKGIPIILPKTKKEESTDFHASNNSTFDYIDHYMKDGDLFDYFQKHDEITENERERLNEIIISHIGDASGRILDVGCGNGWVSKRLQSDENQVVSLDLSYRNVERVLKEQPHPGHVGVVADVFHLPFASNTFDTIIASEIIEHVPDPKRFIACLVEVLKPGGKLIITTPYDEQIPLYLCVHCNQPTPQNAHLHSFNEKNIKLLISREVQEVKIETWINKYLLKLRAHWLMRHFPFGLWRSIDKLADKLVNKPTRLLVAVRK